MTTRTSQVIRQRPPRMGRRFGWVVVLLGAFLAFSDANAAPPEWGQLAEVTNHPGTFRLEVTRLPSGGFLQLPDNFPTIVRCERLNGTVTQPADFELDATGTKLTIITTPASNQRDSVFQVETAGKTPQSGDGRIVFLTKDAVRKVTDAAGTNVTDGSQKPTTFTWQYDATRWGKYAIWLTYAAVAAETEIEFEMAGTRIIEKLRSSGSDQRFMTRKLGTLYLPQATSYTPTIRFNSFAGQIRAVLLTPACEGKPPVQAGDAPIVLHSRDSTVHGTVLRYEPDPKKNTLGYWIHETDGASWKLTVNRPGEYDVEVLQGCGKGEGGSDVIVHINSQALPFVVEETGHFQNFKPRIIGRVKLISAGDQTVVVRPKKIARHAALDLRQIRLIPTGN